MEKGYLVDAAARTITDLDIESYKTMRPYLPGGICIGMVFETGDVLYVDDEALLHPATVAFRIRKRPDGQPMMSNAILTGRDDVHGTLPPMFTIAELQEQIEWLDLDEALAWFRAKADEPAVTSRRAGESRQVHATWSDILANLEGRKGFDPRTSRSLQNAVRKAAET